MQRNRILIVDDERDLCEILQFNLVAAGYEAEVAYSAEEAMRRMEGLKNGRIEEFKNGRIEGFKNGRIEGFKNGRIEELKEGRREVVPFDLFLLDVMMPGMSGFELATLLKSDERTAHIPIIFLTARDTEEDMLHGFGLGADDYVSKPFSVREVLARVKAVLARAHSLPGGGALQRYEGLLMDGNQKAVSVDTKPVAFTRTEFDLLWLLLMHRGTVFSRQQLLERVWPKDVIVTERTVDVNMARLRKKLGRYAQCVVARQGYGYCFEGLKD